ncbi:HipA N-terminal domain-containing protein [uncultured Parabacteroides sp.]|uniref:HipA N-terminal domain-containing protein n=1 Tax=uncultured Parabacteroides sp. TaxID=512312 RepID=UPI002621A4D0|nr:HipA N-terminal domain-containing protein [uncultured Parabacteroides sp.]
MKKAEIHIGDQLAGLLIEDENGFTFTYTPEYISQDHPQPVSLTLPIAPEPYTDTILFPFFDGLIPEGWLLDIAEQNWKINARDRMSLLLACCKDCIGNISVIAQNEEEKE